MSITSTDSEWNITTDIYDIVDTVDKLKARYIDDVNETTLALGIFGFIGDVEAKKIQSATIMAGELGNEMFPVRAKLDKNILAHAIYCNIEGINATPAQLTMYIGIKTSDLDLYMNNNEFIFSRNCGMFIGSYEFHLDYDIILKRVKPIGSDHYIYTATYDMENVNEISDIKSAYLAQPIIENFNNFEYVTFITKAHQVSIKEDTQVLISDSIINNKSLTFTFTDQLANFELYITDEGRETRLTPMFFGSSIPNTLTDYCWYFYIDDHTVRVSFDVNSYIPGLNSEVRLVIRTTKGAEANFTYTDDIKEDIYCDFISQYSNNKKITCFIRCATDSNNGKDRKSIAELKSLIPKMAMSRGYITTETDLNNYFNLISDETNVIKLQKKVDNQLDRIWYAYYLLKDEQDNIIPTNTFNIRVDLTNPHIINVEDGRYIIPTGITFRYDRANKYAEIYDGVVPEGYTDEYFADRNIYYYKSIQNIVINVDPQYAAYYLTLIDSDSYFNYSWVNEKAFFGFTTIVNHFERKMLSEQNDYIFTFQITQSVSEDYGMIVADDEGHVTVNKIKCFIILYKDDVPYRYQECEMTSYTDDFLTSTWKAVLSCDNKFDTENNINITNLYEYGYTTINNAYFDNNCKAVLYVAAELDQVYPDEDNLLAKLGPDLSTYSLLDIYEVEGGLTLFQNFTTVMNTRVAKIKNTESLYQIYGVPMVGYHYFRNEELVSYLINALYDKKAYIDYCLTLIETTMNIDFKLFNTYGYSETYIMGYEGNTSLGHIDINLDFRLKLQDSTDLATRDSIILFIKEYIEDVNDQGDLHFPNLIHDIKEKYNDTIIYIEFIDYNDNEPGINHIQLRDIIDPQTVPEFINVRNKLADDGITLKPEINIEVVTD